MRPPARPRRVATVRPDRERVPVVPAQSDRSDEAGSPAGHPPTAAAARRPPEPSAVPDMSSRPARTPAPAEHSGSTAPSSASSTSGGMVTGPGGRGRGWQPVRPAVVSEGSAVRFAERAAMRRRLLQQRAAYGTVGVVVVAALAWLLLGSPVLALDLEQVELHGQGTVVDADAVAAVVDRYDRTPLPRLDTVGLRRAVLDVPGVRAAEVERLWPRGLRITVISREPVAAVPTTDPTGFALLDIEGVQVGRADAAPEDLPVISVPLEDPGARAMTAVLAVLQQLPAELAAEIDTVAAQTQDTVAFELADGARVEWGSADRTALKVRVLETLRAAEASSGAKVYDVSAPTLPITRS